MAPMEELMKDRARSAQSDERSDELRQLRDEVAALREAVVGEGEATLAKWGVTSDGARNLAHYLALRGRDLRALQVRLAAYGLSSLGRSEADVLAALELPRQRARAHALPFPWAKCARHCL
jgi:pyruvate kinase